VDEAYQGLAAEIARFRLALAELVGKMSPT
jgi:hypothetical protein